MLRTMPPRAWLSLLAGMAATLVLAVEGLQAAASPAYADVQLSKAGALWEATLELDRREIRWRARPEADGSPVVGIEQGRLAEARRVLSAEGLVRRPRSPRSPAAELGVEARTERTLEARVNRLLKTTVGPGRARVGLDLELDLDRRSQRRLRYGRRAAALSRRLERWRLRGDFQNGRGDYEDVIWARDRLVEAVRFAPGRVRRLSASIVVDPEMPPRDVRALRATVGAALGVLPRRGDTLRVARVPFEPPATAPGRPVQARVLVLIPWAVLGVALSLFTIELWRCLRRRPREISAPAWLHDGRPTGR